MLDRLIELKAVMEKKLVNYDKGSMQWIKWWGKIKYLEGRIDQIQIYGG